ncbi:hypothetical protein QTH91_05880 [Variovorax dokdonensis]|uniref:Uncharacterized protein n=1 Tax=Variovorax dokdonensis TaxID=344883 RepID=A0ABT7N7T3_9BURK|nr:hypothetical protein [Variovorax dokdonensis]MDM0044003.1 hypothetical protein [Variovorax dokdonensis]
MTEPHPLVGSHFLSRQEDGRFHWQGDVVSVVETEKGPMALCQLYSWVGGFPTNKVLVFISEMGFNTYLWFSTAEDRNDYYYQHS